MEGARQDGIESAWRGGGGSNAGWNRECLERGRGVSHLFKRYSTM